MKPAFALACCISLLPQNRPDSKKPAKEKKPPPSIAWFDGSFEQAKAAAQERNVPLLIIFIQDNEEANDRIRADLHQDPDFLQAVERCVNVLACDSVHEQAASPGGRMSCKVFPGIPCARHRQLAGEAFHAFAVEGSINTPMHVLLSPKGEEVKRLYDVFPHEDLLEPLRSMRRKLGKGLSAEEHRACLANLEEAGKQIRLKDYALAHKLLQEIASKVQAGGTAAQTKELLAEIDARGKKALEEAAALLAKGAFVDAAKEIDASIAKFAGSPVEASFKKERARLFADPKAKPLLVPYEWLLKAQELEKAGKKADALRSYKRLAEKYPDTEEGRAAKDRAEELEKPNSP